MSCSNQSKEDVPFALPQLIDTFSNNLVLFEVDKMDISRFYPIYIGSDSVIILNFLIAEYSNHLKMEIFIPNPEQRTKLYVDTSTIIGSSRRWYNVPPPPGMDSSYDPHISFKSGRFKSMPIYIHNEGPDSITFGHNAYLPLIVEAKDSMGIWQPIQRLRKMGCGTGLESYIIPPNQFMISTVPLFKGNFKTLLRVRSVSSTVIINEVDESIEDLNRVIYSNEFEGFINYNQFKEMD
ncbi:MAG: hypothetical protein JXR19_04240 [Bacteroidia bacterium]